MNDRCAGQPRGIRRFTRLAGLIVLLAFAGGVILTGCGGNPNETVEADEFIRAAPAGGEPSAGDAIDAGVSGDVGQEDDDPEESGPGEEDADPVPEPSDPLPQSGSSPPGELDDLGGFDDIDLADNVVRRYLNGAYRFSLDLVCGAFCSVDTTGLDRILFVSDSGLAFIDISVLNPSLLGLGAGLPALEAEWEQRRGGAPGFNVLSREDTVLPSDGQTPGRLIQWEVDQRALGGDLLQIRSLLVQVGPLAYFIETGAPEEELPNVEADLQAAVDSFIATPNPPSLPGRYTRFGFVFLYDHRSVTAELGTPLPTFDLGLFEQRALDGLLEMLLRWETVGEEFFDADDAVGTLEEGLINSAVEATELERADLQLPDAGGRFAVFAAVLQGGLAVEVGLYAWYCQDSGRSFVLQSLSRNDVRAMVQPTLDAFRCTGGDGSAP